MKLEDIKIYLRIDGDEEDGLLNTMMAAGEKTERMPEGFHVKGSV